MGKKVLFLNQKEILEQDDVKKTEESHLIYGNLQNKTLSATVSDNSE